ncbi:MAG TPA: ATP-binding protein [Pyrinomonadaceae bacterium]|nr:ATP-binding protein [Pyrinomonadaceae bacterium]
MDNKSNNLAARVNDNSHEKVSLGQIARRPNLLIVDDSAVVRKSIRTVLERFYDCSEAASVLEAFNLLKSQNFELVITDVLMPGLSGIELVRRVSEAYPDTAIIVVSGVDRPQRALDAVRLGAFDYLIKPYDNEVLEWTVSRALERRELILNSKKYKADLELRNQELLRGKRELERLQAQIVQNEKMASLGQLAAGVAHELNNPVGYLYGNLDLVDSSIQQLLDIIRFYDDLDLPSHIREKIEEYKKSVCFDQTVADIRSILADCRDGAERVRDIVQNLRTFSRLDEAEFKRTDLHEGIDSTIRLLSRYFSGGKIRLIRDYSKVSVIEAFPAQLNQVWMNLLVNAAQAIGPNAGEVKIKTWEDDQNVCVEISDTGPGIPSDILNRIFDPFFTTKPVGEGTGLGLSITFGIIERHDGEITVRNLHPHGACFTVKIPKISRRLNNSRESGNYNYKEQLVCSHATKSYV